ncbi:hypothetical protein EUX98_g5406 [Antrodiella citrinella]|uniref:Uncharacterized protein n=1 Tax=Antrodiella citrinella TaxID=2447956 RepID=A0A4S4MSJ1_9APHY|nr:hypothetical protein EUX98_g5406 [Antrodiella citrinella]
MSSDKSTSQDAGLAGYLATPPHWCIPQGLSPVPFASFPVPGSSSQYSHLHWQLEQSSSAQNEHESAMFDNVNAHHYYFPVASGSGPSQNPSYGPYYYYDDAPPHSPSNYDDMNYDSNHHGYDVSNVSLVATPPPVPDHTNMSPAASSSGSHFDTASSSSASFAISNVAQVSGTLHQYACGKQRRSRHDPGGGPSLYGHTETPQIGAHQDMELEMPQHSDEPLPIASPNSSALFGAVAEPAIPCHTQRRPSTTVSGPPEDIKQTTYQPSPPMAHLPYYREDARTQPEADSWSPSTKAHGPPPGEAEVQARHAYESSVLLLSQAQARMWRAAGRLSGSLGL